MNESLFSDTDIVQQCDKLKYDSYELYRTRTVTFSRCTLASVRPTNKDIHQMKRTPLHLIFISK